MNEIADTLLEAVLERFPNSFSSKRYQETDDYLDLVKSEYYRHKKLENDLLLISNDLKNEKLEKHIDIINKRPNNKTELPTFIDNIGTLTFQYLLDF